LARGRFRRSDAAGKGLGSVVAVDGAQEFLEAVPGAEFVDVSGQDIWSPLTATAHSKGGRDRLPGTNAPSLGGLNSQTLGREGMTRSHRSGTDRKFRLLAEYRGSTPVLDHQHDALLAALSGVDASIYGQVDHDSIGFDLEVLAPDFAIAVVAGTEVLALAMASADMGGYDLVAVEALTVAEHARRIGWSNRRPVQASRPVGQ